MCVFIYGYYAYICIYFTISEDVVIGDNLATVYQMLALTGYQAGCTSIHVISLFTIWSWEIDRKAQRV